MSDSQSKFAKAMAARNAEKAEEAARKANGGSYGNYVDIPWSALAPNVEKVVRLIGGPCVEGREPTDCKKIFTSMILGDDDKKFRVFAPDPKERKDWILHKIIKEVLSYDWDPDGIAPDGRKGVRIYHHAKSHPDIFNRVMKNNKVDNPYEDGWKFSASMIFNVIDRGAMDWHRDQKQLRLLSKKAGAPDEKGKVWFDYGVPTTVYNLIVDDILSMDGNTDWNDYDIVIKKLSDDPWYKVYHGIDDAKRISDETKKLVHAGPLTDEERSWKPWDLDKLFPITEYKRIKDHLGIFIQQVGKVFGKPWYEELCELTEKEEAEKAKQKAEQAPATAVPDHPTLSEAPVNTAPAEAPEVEVENPALDPYSQPAAKPAAAPAAQPAAPAQAAPAQTRPSFAPAPKEEPKPVANPLSKMTEEKWKGLMDGSLTGRVYQGVAKMTPEEKALVLDVNMETGTFVWDERAGDLYEGASSGFPSPACVHVDPFDGTEFPPDTIAPMPALN